eukprot:249155_1
MVSGLTKLGVFITMLSTLNRITQCKQKTKPGEISPNRMIYHEGYNPYNKDTHDDDTKNTLEVPKGTNSLSVSSKLNVFERISRLYDDRLHDDSASTTTTERSPIEDPSPHTYLHPGEKSPNSYRPPHAKYIMADDKYYKAMLKEAYSLMNRGTSLSIHSDADDSNMITIKTRNCRSYTRIYDVTSVYGEDDVYMMGRFSGCFCEIL